MLDHEIIIDSELEEDTSAVEELLVKVIPSVLEAEGVEFVDETHVDMRRFQVPFLPMV